MDDTIVNPFDIILPNYEDEGTLKPTIDRAVHEDAEPPMSNFFEEAMRDTISSYENFIVPYNTITASEEDTISKYDPISNLLGSPTRSEGETLTTKTSTGPQGTLIDQDASVPITSPPTRSNLDVVETTGAFNRNSNNEDAPDTDPPNVSTRSDTSTLETPTSSPFAASSDKSASIGATRSSFSSDADCCNGPPNIGSQPPYISTPRPKSGTERDDESTAFVPKEKHTSSVVDKSKRNPCGPTSSIEVPAERSKKTKGSQAKLPNRTRLPHWNPLQVG